MLQLDMNITQNRIRTTAFATLSILIFALFFTIQTPSPVAAQGTSITIAVTTACVNGQSGVWVSVEDGPKDNFYVLIAGQTVSVEGFIPFSQGTYGWYAWSDNYTVTTASGNTSVYTCSSTTNIVAQACQMPGGYGYYSLRVWPEDFTTAAMIRFWHNGGGIDLGTTNSAYKTNWRWTQETGSWLVQQWVNGAWYTQEQISWSTSTALCPSPAAIYQFQQTDPDTIYMSWYNNHFGYGTALFYSWDGVTYKQFDSMDNSVGSRYINTTCGIPIWIGIANMDSNGFSSVDWRTITLDCDFVTEPTAFLATFHQPNEMEFSWAHDGVNLTGFEILAADQTTVLAYISDPAARSHSLYNLAPGVHEFYIRALSTTSHSILRGPTLGEVPQVTIATVAIQYNTWCESGSPAITFYPDTAGVQWSLTFTGLAPLSDVHTVNSSGLTNIYDLNIGNYQYAVTSLSTGYNFDPTTATVPVGTDICGVDSTIPVPTNFRGHRVDVPNGDGTYEYDVMLEWDFNQTEEAEIDHFNIWWIDTGSSVEKTPAPSDRKVELHNLDARPAPYLYQFYITSVLADGTESVLIGPVSFSITGPMPTEINFTLLPLILKND